MGGGNNVLIDFTRLATIAPSDSTVSPVKRTFSKNTLVNAIATSNYYGAGACKVSITANTFNISSINGYGIGWVLPKNVYGGQTYNVISSCTTGLYLTFLYYSTDGTFLGNKNFGGTANSSDNLTIPSNAEYIVLAAVNDGNTTSGVIEIKKIKKIV